MGVTPIDYVMSIFNKSETLSLPHAHLHRPPPIPCPHLIINSYGPWHTCKDFLRNIQHMLLEYEIANQFLDTLDWVSEL